MKFTKLGLIVLGSAGLFVLGSHQVSAKTVLDTNSDYYMPAVFPNHHLTYNMQSMNKKDQYVYKIAFKNWQEALNNQITFSQNSNKYQVKLFSAKNGDFYTDKNGNQFYQLAVTNLSYSGLVANSAKIYMFDKTIKKMGENKYRYRLAIAEHEIGHLLGLGEFDHAKNDVMSRYSDLNDKDKITKLDIQEAVLENHLGSDTGGSN
mgnify:CR=1 FL=1